MTPYESWLTKRFGGPTPLQGLKKYLDELRRSTGQQKLPVQLTLIAKKIGLNPIPIYKRLPVTGCLMPKDGLLRIALNRPSGRPVTRDTPNLGRFRFTYAHEVIHSLAYDLRVVPNQRLAPLPKADEEEILCNHAARHLLLPREVLYKETLATSRVDAQWFDSTAKKADVSYPVLAMQLFEENLLPKSPLEICLLSRIGYGSDGKGDQKPRCINGRYTDMNGRHFRVLGPNEGLDRIKVTKGAEAKWSLVNFHEEMRSSTYSLIREVSNEILVFPNKTRVHFTGRHEQAHRMGYIWTMGKLEPVT